MPSPIFAPAVSGLVWPSPKSSVVVPIIAWRQAVTTSKRTVVGALTGSGTEYVMFPYRKWLASAFFANRKNTQNEARSAKRILSFDMAPRRARLEFERLLPEEDRPAAVDKFAGTRMSDDKSCARIVA